MKLTIRAIARYIPLAVGIVILVIGASFIPWHKVVPYLGRITPLYYGLFLALGLTYQLGRGFRYWLMFRILGRPASFKLVALACMAAQPISVLPGGELYRSVMLKKYANVDFKDSTPSVLAQTISEGIILVTISIIGASVLKKYVGITFLAGFIFLVLWVILSQYKGRKAHRLLNIVPGINLHPARVRAYLDKNKILLSNMNFLYLLAGSTISVISGIGLVITTGFALGHPLSVPQAAIVFALPTALEIFSFLPGGIGVSEISAIGLLALFGFPAPLAISLTLIVRLSTLGLGFVYGFMVMGYLKVRRYTVYE